MSLIVRNHYTLNHRDSTTTIPSPTDAGALIADQGPRVQLLPKSTGPRIFEPGVPAQWAPGEAGRSTVEAQRLDMGSVGDSLQQSVGLVDAMVSLGKSTSDVFPANRVFMRCAKCRAGIGRFEGYRHIRVGDHKTYCEGCQKAMGLPVRTGGGGPPECA